MTQEDNHIIADEGKVFVRKETQENYGSEIYLGYSYYIGGVKLDTPHQDVAEDFEEVDDDTLTDSDKQFIELEELIDG